MKRKKKTLDYIQTILDYKNNNTSFISLIGAE